MHQRPALALACIALALQGCAMTPQQFNENKAAMSDLDVCVEARKAHLRKDQAVLDLAIREAVGRGVGGADCARMAQEAAERQQRIVTALLIVGAVAIAANARGGRGSGSAYSDQPVAPAPLIGVSDYSWEWDQFNNEYGTPIWRCRGEQTGQFAPELKCAGKMQQDWRWPGLIDTFRR